MKKILIIIIALVLQNITRANTTIDSIKFSNFNNIIACKIYETRNYGTFYRRKVVKVENDTLKFTFYSQGSTSTNLSLIKITDSNNYINSANLKLCAYAAYAGADTNSVDTTLFIIPFSFVFDSIIESTNLCAPLQLNYFNTSTNLSYNPATKSLITTTKSDIRLYNLDGKLIYAKQNSEGQLPLPADLPSGIYLAVCNHKNGVERLKIWVE